MKFILTSIVLLWLLAPGAVAQSTNLFYSRQTGQATHFSGSYTKQTDKFEQATIKLSTLGPITYAIQPASYSIQPNEHKSWNGSISIDAQTAPPAGNQSTAQLIAHYNVQYSRPYGLGTNGTTLSTYSCADSSGMGGCVFHNGKPGMHEIVQDTDQYPVDFTVYSIKADIPDTICLEPSGQGQSTALGFPATGGTFQWSSTHPKVKISNSNQQTAAIQLQDTTVKNAVVQVKYTIQGISYEDQGVLAVCNCSCKPLTNELNAGPVVVKFAANPTANGIDGNGDCQYAANDAAITLQLDGVIKQSFQLNTDVNVTVGKNCQTGAVNKIGIAWKGSLDLPDIEIAGVKVFGLKAKETQLTVSAYGNLSGTVTLNVSNAADRDLSLGKEFLMLRKGTNADVTFSYNNTNGWAGQFDFSTIKAIKIDMQKTSGGKKTVIASFTGDMTTGGLLTGDFTALGNARYETNLFTVTLKQLKLGTEMDLTAGTFRLTSGNGQVQLSDIKAINGTIDLGLDFPAAGGCVATVASTAQISAFTMTLDELNLQADFNKEFDVTKVEGSLKAKHNSFDVKINVDKFKISNGSLDLFSCSGGVTYSGFRFTLQKGVYAPVKLSIDARVELSATGTAAMMAVKGFTIDQNGNITVGNIKGNLNKAPATVSFDATFANSRFTGSFSGKFADIGLDGSIDIGSEQNPEYHFAYLAITAKANVPLGNSGLKLTQVGGKLGYNYALQSPSGPGNPQQGTYLAGLKLGVADVGNMCEVTGETIIQFGNGNVDIMLKGNVAVLKNNKFFEGTTDVTYKIPAQTLSGSVGAVIWIPGNGWVFKSRNLRINFFFGNNQFNANGNNMGGEMFGGKIQLTHGHFRLNGNLRNINSLTGSMGGRATARFAYQLSVSKAGNSVSGSISLNLNSQVNIAFNQDGINGTFQVHADGRGTLAFDTWIYSDTITASATADGAMGYNGNNLNLSGNIIVTLPFSIPFWGNQISTGQVSISI